MNRIYFSFVSSHVRPAHNAAAGTDTSFSVARVAETEGLVPVDVPACFRRNAHVPPGNVWFD